MFNSNMVAYYWDMAGTTALMSIGNLLVIFIVIRMICHRLGYFRTMVVLIVMYTFCARESPLANIDEGEQNHGYMQN